LSSSKSVRVARVARKHQNTRFRTTLEPNAGCDAIDGISFFTTVFDAARMMDGRKVAARHPGLHSASPVVQGLGLTPTITMDKQASLDAGKKKVRGIARLPATEPWCPSGCRIIRSKPRGPSHADSEALRFSPDVKPLPTRPSCDLFHARASSRSFGDARRRRRTRRRKPPGTLLPRPPSRRSRSWTTPGTWTRTRISLPRRARLRR